MKVFLLCLVLGCCILIGLKIKEYFKRRQIFYQNFCVFCEKLQNKISFSNTKIKLIILEEIDVTVNQDFKNFLVLFLD